MAKRGRKPQTSKRIEGFAEDLGRLLGQAQAKAEGWLQQRHTIAKQLDQIRHAAGTLLTEMSSTAAAARGRGKSKPAVAAPRKKRKLSAAARKAISDAQKRRWAAARAAKK